MKIYDWTDKANELLSAMTLDEKITQMRYESIGIDRLGLKSYVWWNEALHGIARAGVATMFPQSIGLAAMFNSDLMYKIADCISTEARAKYNEFQRRGDHGIYKGLTFWSPNVNIFRDPRWGRGHETYGEDPYLTARMGVAFIKGMQGDDPNFLKTAACAKHFAVHSGPESERHSFNVEVSDKDLFETYLPAFEACVREAGVESVMGAYNAVGGEPCCGSKRMLVDILRKMWGFEGHVVSDCGAIQDFHTGHCVTSTPAQSAAMAVKAGCDLNCGSVFGYLLMALSEGLLTEGNIDLCVRRLLVTRLKLGTVGSETPWDNISYERNDHPSHHLLSLKAAQESLVLLKNDGILPMNADKLRNIAIIGPNADNKTALEGNYSGTASVYQTVLQGLQTRLNSKVRVFYAQGCPLGDSAHYDDCMLSEAVSTTMLSDAVVLCVGLDATLEGEQGDTYNNGGSGDRLDLLLPAPQRRLMEAIKKTKKPVILVNLSGGAIDLSYAEEHYSAIVQAWYPGQMGGEAVAGLLFGDYSPSGRLPVTFYRTITELPPFEDYSMESRTYRFMKTDALYPFGYGLSFTTFVYKTLRAEKTTILIGEEYKFNITVQNAGECDGIETTQVYIQNLDADIRVPKWELCGFQKSYINAGQETELSFTIGSRSMAVIQEDGTSSYQPGRFRLYIGGSQPDERSKQLLGGSIEVLEFTLHDQ